MTVLAAATEKVEAVLSTIRSLKAGGFPHADTEGVLKAIEAVFTDHRQRLSQLGDAPTAGPVYCQTVLQAVADYLPILGILHRSKHASNPFEIHGPLRRLAKQLLGEETVVVVSSEWDFSPFTMIGIEELPSVVLVGLPASECTNALLTPLAGHELGHSLWTLETAQEPSYELAVTKAVLEAVEDNWQQFSSQFAEVKREDLATDMFARARWEPSAIWSLRQCEEIFCDLVGLRIFGEAYLHAFAYLLAPGFQGERSVFYPSERQRAEFLRDAATRFGLTITAGYAETFLEPAKPSSPSRELRLLLADAATRKMVPALTEHVDSTLSTRGVSLPTSSQISAVHASFSLFVPAPQPASLAAIVNAGWQSVKDENLWSNYSQLEGVQHRKRHLNELILKTTEVLEINFLQVASNGAVMKEMA